MTTTDDPAADPDLLARELAGLELTSLTHDDAWTLGTWLWRTAVERGLAVTVDVRRGDQQLFHAARPGTSPDNDQWIERKIRVVRRFGEASYLVGLRLALAGRTLASRGVDPLTHAAAGGCVPLVVVGAGPIGTLTVSGLTGEEDHLLAVEALRSLAARQS